MSIGNSNFGFSGGGGSTPPPATTEWLLDGNTVGSQKYFGTNDNYSIPIYTNGVARGIFTSSGDFGFGMVLPTARVHIQGSDSTLFNYGLKIDNSSSSPMLYVANNGYIGMGIAVPTARLDIVGLGNTSLTSSLNIKNSSLSPLLYVGDDGVVGFGTSTPASSSILDLTSTTKGLLTPRMTTGQRDLILSPSVGLFIYNTSTSFFNYWDGSAWIQVDSSTGGDVSGSGTTNYAVMWTDGGNSVVGNSTWYYSTNDYLPVTSGSNIGDATHRIGTIFMASVFDYSNSLTFYNGTSTTMTLTTGGDLGIAISPTARLHVQGIDSTSSNYAMKIDSSDSSAILYVLNNGRVGVNNSTPNNADSEASEISIGNSSKAATGITFFTTTTSTSHLFFADGNSGSSLYRGAISYRHTTDDLLLRAGWNGSTTTGINLKTSTLTVDHQPATTGATTPFSFTTPASTNQTLSTETIGVRFNMSATIQHATGALTTQRDFVIDARTHSFVGASTITNAATLAISAAPIAGTNATITNGYALWLQSGNMLISSGTLSISAPTASATGASVFTSSTVLTGANSQNPSGMSFVHSGTGFGSTIYYGIGVQNRSSSALSAGMGVGILMGLGYGGGSFINTRITSYSIGAVSSSLNSAFGIQTSIGGAVAERFTFYKESFGINTTTPNSYLQINGSFSTAYVQKTAAYVITSSDFTIECTSGTFDITLPTAVGITGRIYVIANSGAGTITLATTSSQTIDGNASGVLTLTQNKSYTVQSNNSNWVIIAVK